MSTETAPARFNDILCIGIGLSGVCLAIQLKRVFGFENVHLYDRNESHSGTWWANRYPGCACDVPAIYYSFSFGSNPGWTRLFPYNDEIREYLEGVVEKYQIRPRMTFRTECESAHWDSKRQRWTAHLRDLTTGERYTHECRLLFSAVGVLVDGKSPDIPGMETFEGAMFHTARWRSDVNLEGKDVIVIGNGCSASQAVPQITPKAKTLTQFIRTPHWLVEIENIKFGPGVRWAFRNIPLLTRAVRVYIFIIFESHWRRFLMNSSGARIRRSLEKASVDHIHHAAPEKYHDILVPDWQIACKRMVLDNGYLKTLHARNLHLTRDPIVEVTPRGVRTATKAYPADVIVLATGFHTNNGLGSLRIEGRNGKWLDDHWKNMGGPGAYNSTAVSGYPNFFMLLGPNSLTGHHSVLFTIENMVNFALKIAKPVIFGDASEVELTQQAEKDYSRRLQLASGNKLWNTCSNWYVTNGWNSTMYPWNQSHFWWRSVFPTWNDWKYKGMSTRVRRSRLRKVILLFLFIVSILGGMATLNGPRRLAARLADGLVGK